ncbi:MAG: DUF6671 family protein [Ferrimicrobium sp.]
MTGPHLFQGRQAALATKHNKLAQIGPPLQAAVGLDVVVADVDTDLFGTFTGETPRLGGPLETAIAKARAAAEVMSLSLGLASEGSFGPYPHLPFVPSDLEIVVLVNREFGYHVAEEGLTTETNFAYVRLTPDEAFDEFLRSAGFPSHAVVVLPSVGPGPIVKGITDLSELATAISACAAVSTDGRALVQTDMRAHCNPTRQRQIAQVANQLAQRLSSCCPECGTPGWGAIETVGGLPCGVCQAPTGLTSTIISGCPMCSHREVQEVDGVAPAGCCALCNP